MILYIIKSTLCSGFFIGIYYFLLEREKMHQFNRFYLLGVLLLSLIIPNIEITTNTSEIVEPLFTNISEVFVLHEKSSSPINDFVEQTDLPQKKEITQEIVPSVVPTIAPILTPSIVPTTTTTTIIAPSVVPSINYSILLWIGYLIITMIFAFRFTKNLISIFKTARGNKTISYKNALLVLLEKEVVSYTFLNYIFVNKTEYQDGKINKEVLTHEMTHVDQKHTIDILFIELLHVLFWFNPIILIYKKAIKLNHEFIADEKVIQAHDNLCGYQELLMSTATNNKIQMVSCFNFLVLKKRLNMMSVKKNKSVIFIKKICVVPLIFSLVLFFSQRLKAKNDLNLETNQEYQISGINLGLEEGAKELIRNVDTDITPIFDTTNVKNNKVDFRGQVKKSDLVFTRINPYDKEQKNTFFVDDKKNIIDSHEGISDEVITREGLQYQTNELKALLSPIEIRLPSLDEQRSLKREDLDKQLEVELEPFMKEVISQYNKNRKKEPHIGISHYREKAKTEGKYIMYMESIGYSIYAGNLRNAAPLSNYKFFYENTKSHTSNPKWVDYKENRGNGIHITNVAPSGGSNLNVFRYFEIKGVLSKKYYKKFNYKIDSTYYIGNKLVRCIDFKGNNTKGSMHVFANTKQILKIECSTDKYWSNAFHKRIDTQVNIQFNYFDKTPFISSIIANYKHKGLEYQNSLTVLTQKFNDFKLTKDEYWSMNSYDLNPYIEYSPKDWKKYDIEIDKDLEKVENDLKSEKFNLNEQFVYSSGRWFSSNNNGAELARTKIKELKTNF